VDAIRRIQVLMIGWLPALSHLPGLDKSEKGKEMKAADRFPGWRFDETTSSWRSPKCPSELGLSWVMTSEVMVSLQKISQKHLQKVAKRSSKSDLEK
jgi:hypothetical protein